MEKLFPAWERLGMAISTDPLLAASLPETLIWLGTEVP